MRALAIALLALMPLASSAGELVLLPIQNIETTHHADHVQIVVTVEFQACRYNYKGLYVEQVASGQGQARYHVAALASETGRTGCEDKADLRSDSANVPLTVERYDFIPMQPK
jgi:hypothetical protein